MPQISAAWGIISGAFTSSAIGTFLTQTFVGRLLSSVALSAVRMALAGKPSTRQTGIRTQQTLTGGITAASFIMGLYATEGQLIAPPMSHGNSGGVPNAYLTYVIELGDVPLQTLEGLIVDGEKATIGATVLSPYGRPIEGQFLGHGWVQYYNGAQTNADPMLLDKYGSDPDRPWLADMVGRNTNYAILTFLYNREIYNSFPSVRFEMGGIRFYDPRKDDTVGGSGTHRWASRATWEPTENLAVQAYNIMRGIDLGGGHKWGGDCEAEDLPLSNWWAAMNKADVAITLDGGGTEPQYRSSYEVFVDDEPATVLEDMLRGASGAMAENGGIWKIRLGAPDLPVYFFTDDDVLVSEDEVFTPFSADQEPINGIQATYPDPASLWEPRDAPEVLNAAYEAADGQRNAVNLTLPATPYPFQVQRTMLADLEDERNFRRHKLSLPSDAIPLEPLDVVQWTSERHGYAGKSFEIAASVDPLVLSRPHFTLREIDPANFVWTTADQRPVSTPVLTQTQPPAQAVTGFEVAPVSIDDDDAQPTIPGLRLSWNGNQPDVRGLLWQVRNPDGELIAAGSTQDVAQGSLDVHLNRFPGVALEARAQFVADRATVWSAWVERVTPNVRLSVQQLASGMSGNLLMNTDLLHPVDPLKGIVGFGSGAMASEFTLIRRPLNLSYTNGIDHTLAILQNGTSTTGLYTVAYQVIENPDGDMFYPRIQPGARHEFSANIALLRCDVQLIVIWLGADRLEISRETSEVYSQVPVDTSDPDSWPRARILADAPANAVYGVFGYQPLGTISDTSSFVFPSKPMAAVTHAQATEPSPFVPVGLAYFDGNLQVRGSIQADRLDVNSMQTLGLAVFGQGLISSNFDGTIVGTDITDYGTQGFAITPTAAVLTNMVDRHWLIDGSVSEGEQQSIVLPVTRIEDESMFGPALTPGTMTTNQFWHIAFYAEVRRLGIIEVSGDEGGQAGGGIYTDTSIKRIRVYLLFRGRRDGVWEPYRTFHTSAVFDSDTYEPVEFVGHIQGNYDAAEAVVTIERLDTFPSRTYGAQRNTNTTQNNVRNAALVMNAVVK